MGELQASFLADDDVEVDVVEKAGVKEAQHRDDKT